MASARQEHQGQIFMGSHFPTLLNHGFTLPPGTLDIPLAGMQQTSGALVDSHFVHLPRHSGAPRA